AFLYTVTRFGNPGREPHILDSNHHRTSWDRKSQIGETVFESARAICPLPPVSIFRNCGKTAERPATTDSVPYGRMPRSFLRFPVSLRRRG
ncbi:MAG: hypothetical protein M3Y84_06585, partial [Acidobacteriota bacterium]|nr:hypothetical protein [Acidobacteriota bacterium]